MKRKRPSCLIGAIVALLAIVFLVKPFLFDTMGSDPVSHAISIIIVWFFIIIFATIALGFYIGFKKRK